MGVTLCVFSACHNDIWDAIDGLDGRVTKLEELCKEMNTNITSLQTIVDVLQSNDFITSIVEIKKDGKVVGYTITFGKHDPITIYHGQDGKDGADGKDGQDGQNGSANAPVIGVAQDTDGVYYWTLNGEWLLDDNGNKLPVSGKDGQNGTNGSNGQDGADGQDGKDGITPQLKIEDGYWYVSYDNGTTWTQLGKATGEDGQDGKDGADGEDGKDGQNGADGKDGQDGDSMFQSVTQDENYVYFTLADGTVIKIAKASEEEQPNSEFMFIVTYDANGGEGIMQPDTFYYGVLGTLSNNSYIKENSYFVNWNTKADGSGISYSDSQQLMISKNITLYAQWILAEENGHIYVDLGLSVKWATCNVGASKPEEYGDYFAWGEVERKTNYTWGSYKWCNASYNRLTKYNFHASFGQRDNKYHLDSSDDATIVKWGGNWRMPTDTEQRELCTKCSWEWTTKNGVNGYEITSKVEGYTNSKIFLPAAGYMSEYTLYDVQNYGYYWSNKLDAIQHDIGYRPDWACIVKFNKGGSSTSYDSRRYGYPIRPVCP